MLTAVDNSRAQPGWKSQSYSQNQFIKLLHHWNETQVQQNNVYCEVKKLTIMYKCQIKKSKYKQKQNKFQDRAAM